MSASLRQWIALLSLTPALGGSVDPLILQEDSHWTSRLGSVHDLGYARLRHRSETWYDSTFWQRNDTWLRVDKNWQHPGDRGPSVRRFTAPQQGQVTITGTVRKAHLDGDGVKVFILHNDRTVWEQELDGKDGVGMDPNLTLHVESGDALRFMVEKLGAICCDTTFWDPVLTYHGGPILQASSSFCHERQGVGGWFYEMKTTPSANAGKARLFWFDEEVHLTTRFLNASEKIVLFPEKAQPCFLLSYPEDDGGILALPHETAPWRLECSLSEEGLLSLDLEGGRVRPPLFFTVLLKGPRDRAFRSHRMGRSGENNGIPGASSLGFLDADRRGLAA